MISVVLATYNEEKNIIACLKSVIDFADEVIIVDGSSTDNTVQTIKDNFGKKVKIIKTTNKPNFHINKQMAIDAAQGDLILQLDADEHVDQELKNFILATHANNDQKSISAWYINRRNLFLKRWLRKGGQYPDAVIRLFWKDQAWLPQKDVHEQMAVKGKTATAEGHLMHYSYPSFDLYLHKFNTYTTFKALQLQEQKLSLNFKTFCQYVIGKPIATFCSLYFRHRGYVDGWAGFVFALGSGLHHSVAYLKYYELATPLPEY